MICVAIVLGMLAVGLGPFRPPPNEVYWVGKERGVEFGAHGILSSLGSLPAMPAGVDRSCSLEVCLRPEFNEHANAILTFSTPEYPLHFWLEQYQDYLVVHRESLTGSREGAIIGSPGVFSKDRAIFLSLTSGPHQSAIYVDGQLRRAFPGFHFGTECAGQLTLGSSPVTDSQWKGQIAGLAVYFHELTAEEVASHYRAWGKAGRPEISPHEHAVALYLFNEHGGRTVHDASGSGMDLSIPARYVLPHQRFLQAFWKGFRPGLRGLEDVLINVFGFIPLGVAFRFQWSRLRVMRRPVLATVMMGLGVSFTIEVLQSFLPTRDSGTLDLITNTLGTYIGARLCDFRPVMNRVAELLGE